ncbi:MAG: hypothetical protein WBV82_30990 [Myxococcaceae bacterium]
MKSGIRMAVAVVAAAGLVGCGGAKLGKDEAAAVVFGAGETVSKAQKGGALSLLQSGQGLGSTTVNCTNGGTAKFSVSVDGITGEDSANWLGAFDVEYDGCAEPRADDPNTPEDETAAIILDGKMTIGIDFDINGGGEDGDGLNAALQLRMQGRIDLSGDYSDYVDADITQTVTATANSEGTTATVVINGSIETSSESFTYTNETYAFADDNV